MSETGFGSLGSKILSAANSIAPIAGAATGWMSAPMAEGRGLAGAPAWMITRLKGYKIANPIITTEIALAAEDQYHLIGSIVSAATGMAVREVGQAIGVSAATRMGSALMKYGASAAINGVIAAWVWEAVNNPHGKDGGPTSGQGGAYVSAPARGGNTIDVDNPQGLAPLYSGQSPVYA